LSGAAGGKEAIAMNGPVKRNSMPRLPWGLVAGLIAIAGVEHFVTLHERVLNPSCLTIAKRVGRAAQTEARKCEILCFGDSLTKFGALPRVLEQRLGRTSYNLAIVGGQPPGTYYMLRRALRSGARPAAIVVDFKANCISLTPRFNSRVWTEVLTLAECLDLAVTERDASYFGFLALPKLFPSLKARMEIRALVLTALSGEPTPSPNETAPYLRNINVNKGAVVINDSVQAPWPPQGIIDRDFFPAQWDIHYTNAYYMRRFLKLAAAKRIPVFWLLPPIRMQLQAGRDQGGFDDRYLRAISKLFVRSPNVFLVDARHSGYPDRAFFDVAHLDRSGALALSAGLASAIGTVLDGGKTPPSRIFQLPPFRDYALDPLPEDVDTSRVALRLAPGVVRK
jgi:hypothetical protein